MEKEKLQTNIRKREEREIHKKRRYNNSQHQQEKKIKRKILSSFLKPHFRSPFVHIEDMREQKDFLDAFSFR